MKIDFSFFTQYGTFADALYLPDDHAFSDAQIALMKQERLDNWIAAITTPPAPVSRYVRDVAGNLLLDANGDPIQTGV